MSRANHIQRATSEIFDIVIIGGGITGAGIARTAARKGWKTLIIDKNDFAFGTSSRSAKMIHGGLRYLQQLQIKLVKEALLEREHLLQEYPHLVKPQPFFMPIFKSRFNKLKLGIGLSGYDYLTGASSMPKHAKLDMEEVKMRFPQLKTDQMIGGYVYYDARTNDARLTNEVIQEATDAGAIALNYFGVSSFKKDGEQLSSLTCQDMLTNATYTIQAKVYVSATGIWTDELLKEYDIRDKQTYMMPSKGVHLILPATHFPQDCVLLLPTANGDGRMIWCMPWEDGLCVAGTTDTDYKGGNEVVRVLKEEVDYILAAVNAHIQSHVFTEKDILSVYAGIRPLLNEDDGQKKSNQRSRDYRIWWNNENMLTISGGKFTSFLSMAENCIKEIDKKKIIRTATKEQVSLQTVTDRFKQKYGIKNATHIADIIRTNPALANNYDRYPYCPAELVFFMRHQSALKLEDLLTRRTLISYQMQQFDEDFVATVAQLMSTEFQWTENQIREAIASYKEEWQHMHTWD